MYGGFLLWWGHFGEEQYVGRGWEVVGGWKGWIGQEGYNEEFIWI